MKFLIWLYVALGFVSVAEAQTYPSPQYATVTVGTLLGTAGGAINFPVSPTVPTPSISDNSNNAANTAFVQSLLANVSSGLSPLTPVAAVAAASNVNIASPGFTSLDGVTLTSGTSRIGLIDQTSAAQNGVYIFNGASSALTRSSDANVAADFSNKQVYFHVSAGTTYGGNGYILQNPGTVTLGTTPLNFVLFTSSSLYTAGSGLNLTGSQFSVNFGSTTGTVADGGTLTTTTATANAAQSTANAALPNTTTAYGTAYAAWFATLPTTLPGTAGVYWNNGGILSKS